MEISVTYAYFVEERIDAVSVHQRINAVLKSLENDEDYIVFEDGRKCFNEQELREALMDRGVIEPLTEPQNV